MCPLTHPPPFTRPTAAPQSKTTVEADIQETENGTKKLNVGVARGQAFAANGLECFKEDCADPVAEVRAW